MLQRAAAQGVLAQGISGTAGAGQQQQHSQSARGPHGADGGVVRGKNSRQLEDGEGILNHLSCAAPRCAKTGSLHVSPTMAPQTLQYCSPQQWHFLYRMPLLSPHKKRWDCTHASRRTQRTPTGRQTFMAVSPVSRTDAEPDRVHCCCVRCCYGRCVLALCGLKLQCRAMQGRRRASGEGKWLSWRSSPPR